MQAFELHLSVNQRLQEVASFKRNKYYSEEIDLALNKAMFRLIEKGVETNFQDSQINLATVDSLIQKNRVVDLLIPQSNDPLYEDNVLNVYGISPEDLYWTLNTRTECITDPLNCETAPTLGTITVPEYTAVIGYPTPGPTAPFYPAVAITSTTQGTIYTAPSELAGGVQTSQGVYIITNNIIEQFQRGTNLVIYWERYRDTYQRGKFIIVSKAPLGTVSISSTGLTTTSVASVNTNYVGYNRGAIANLSSKTIDISTSRITRQNDLYQAQYQNMYYASSIEEPLVNETYDYFTIYRDKSFLVTRLYLDYIRKPKVISLSLGQTCELNETTHNKLVDLAVEILRLDTKDQAYQATVQDTELRS